MDIPCTLLGTQYCQALEYLLISKLKKIYASTSLNLFWFVTLNKVWL